MTTREKPEESWKRRGVSATESGGQKRQLKIFPEFFQRGWEISLVEKRLVIIVKKGIFPLLHLFSSVNGFDPLLIPDFPLRVYAGNFQDRATATQSSRTRKSKNDIFERCSDNPPGYH